jgi:hypothetical protein
MFNEELKDIIFTSFVNLMRMRTNGGFLSVSAIYLDIVMFNDNKFNFRFHAYILVFFVVAGMISTISQYALLIIAYHRYRYVCFIP